MSKKTWIIIIVVTIVAVGAFVTINANAKNVASSEYQTVEIERGNLTATVGATGTVRSNQSALLNWQTSGTVDNVNVNVGDEVTAGAILASLERTSLSQNIIMAQSDLVSAEKNMDDLLQSGTAGAQARVDLRNAEDVLEKAQDYRNSLNDPYEFEEIRYQTINGKRFPTLKTIKVDEADDETKEKSDQDLALAQAKYDDALRAWERVSEGPHKSDVTAAQAQIDAAQATMNLARLTAPFESTVTQIDIMPGDQVSAGTLGFRIDDLSHLLVDVELSEVDINRVSIGQVVALSFDAILEEEYHGEVIKVGQIGNEVQGAVNFIVTVELIDADELVRPGMTAAVNIVVKEIEDTILIPNRAVRLVDGNRVVYILKDGMPEMVEIRLGASAEAMSVLASNDLEEGDLIILNPPSNFDMGGGPPGSGQGRN
ncbi:MAG: efflux RND transporter periplasmic adaptor subunit [Anaerolineales bacterium]|uniref:Efflux RND transporter periplasmic adaptor subunit n=1 Tax=Candidatus Desulfolinea nitratireducens TaxID=2841698 RepID=A0A8J6TJX3_9CHLR|nr:efflux RND transporter periplasmic adaptor subunit [Candidatus Desulfolinea nitratireducens]